MENIINLFACKLSKTQAITSIRGNPTSSYLPVYGRFLYKIVLFLSNKWAVKINTNSEEVASVLIDDFHISPEKIKVIYNPKDISHINTLSSEYADTETFSSGCPVILTAGRLNIEKGQWHLIRVFAQLRKKRICKLVICGVGPLKQSLKTLAEELEIENDVYFLGWCSNVYKYMSKSTVFVLPSLAEAQPNVLIEAMICGCPVVAADCDFGPREVLDYGKYGLLSTKLDAGNFDSVSPLSDAEQDMMKKVENIISNPDVFAKYHQLSLERSKVFDRENVMKEYASLFHDVN